MSRQPYLILNNRNGSTVEKTRDNANTATVATGVYLVFIYACMCAYMF